MRPSDLLVQNLPLVERAVAAVCRRRGIFDQDAEDIGQEVLVKLAADDCAALAGFRGESSLSTFVNVVTARICFDEIRRRRGRWRPSLVAERLGYAATRLEILIYRDALGYEEAVAKLLAEGVVRSPDELDEVFPQLPRRPVRTFVDPEDAPEPTSDEDPEGLAEQSERALHQQHLETALQEALQALTPEDRLILRRLFFEGRTVAQVARELGLEQRPLYRRRDRLLVDLRKALEARGLAWDEVDRNDRWDDEDDAGDGKS